MSEPKVSEPDMSKLKLSEAPLDPSHPDHDDFTKPETHEELMSRRSKITELCDAMRAAIPFASLRANPTSKKSHTEKLKRYEKKFRVLHNDKNYEHLSQKGDATSKKAEESKAEGAEP